ncbi:hypothetical protein B0H13DRAFT_2303338 [Mycena leptocephala]|nr:hypothetical protein B0H13DRAFT_2303338 [Mycena leptocephala]
MEPKFSPSTRDRLRKEYGYICSVCLTPQTTTGSQCAHLFPKADRGQDMVGEAISLGMLDPIPGREYNRDSFKNGTIQCATCHLGYFTRGFLVFSPPVPVLEWILEQLDGLEHANAHSVWKIFCFLEEQNGPHLNRFHHLNSLIPRFPSAEREVADWYEIYCNLPPIHTINEEGQFEPSNSRRSRRGVPHFRIFDFNEVLQRRKPSGPVKLRGLLGAHPGVIRLFPGATKDKGPTNYWRVPVPCHVMLFLLINAVQEFKFNYSLPEVALAMKIYRRLTKIRNMNDRPENGAGRHLRAPQTPHSSPRHHHDCRHPVKGNSSQYCTQCWTLSPSNFPPLSDAEDITPSRTTHAAPRRPLIPAISFESGKAYPTPTSLPKPERESGLDYFTGTSSARSTGTSNSRPSSVASKLSTSGSSSRTSSPTPSGSDDDPEYLPGESGNSDGERDSDSGDTEASTQDSSEDALE